jgi:hypothetical protein
LLFFLRHCFRFIAELELLIRAHCDETAAGDDCGDDAAGDDGEWVCPAASTGACDGACAPGAEHAAVLPGAGAFGLSVVRETAAAADPVREFPRDAHRVRRWFGLGSFAVLGPPQGKMLDASSAASALSALCVAAGLAARDRLRGVFFFVFCFFFFLGRTPCRILCIYCCNANVYVLSSAVVLSRYLLGGPRRLTTTTREKKKKKKKKKQNLCILLPQKTFFV